MSKNELVAERNSTGGQLTDFPLVLTMIAGLALILGGGIAMALEDEGFFALSAVGLGFAALIWSLVLTVRATRSRGTRLGLARSAGPRPEPQSWIERQMARRAAPLMAALAFGSFTALRMSGLEGADHRVFLSLWVAVVAGGAALLLRPRRARVLFWRSQQFALLTLAVGLLLSGLGLLDDEAILPGAPVVSVLVAAWFTFGIVHDARRPQADEVPNKIDLAVLELEDDNSGHLDAPASNGTVVTRPTQICACDR